MIGRPSRNSKLPAISFGSRISLTRSLRWKKPSCPGLKMQRAGQLSHTVLAEKVGMERTTLTRNLRPLTRAKWVAAATGKDRRQHLLQLTAAGRRKVVSSLPLWEEAQRQFLSQIGSESLQELRALLASSESAATKANTVNQENSEPARLSARKKSGSRSN